MTDLDYTKRLFRNPDLSPELARNWHRQQQEARAVLRRFKQGFSTVLIADEVGMGKTYVALSVMARHADDGEKTLLIVPGNAMLIRKWMEEIKKFNASYLSKGHYLRPLLIKDRNELLFGLHSYENRNIHRVHARRLSCFTLIFQTWYNDVVRRQKTWKKKWLDDKDMPDDITFQTFCAEFSPSRIRSFLDEWRHEKRREFEELCAENGLLNAAMRACPEQNRARAHASAELNRLFREFSGRQNDFSPNVFVMTMDTIRRQERKPSPFTPLLKKYLLGLLLYHKHKATAARILAQAKKLGWTGREDTEDRLKELGGEDLWGLRQNVKDLMEQKGIRELFCEKRQGLGLDAKVVEQRAAEVLDDVFQKKLTALSLLVVDEAHNWKSGRSNGAARFRKSFAHAFRHRLLMSATPFQIHERELLTVFETVTGDTSDKALERVRDILAPEGAASAALRLSNEFSEAWNALTPAHMLELNRPCDCARDLKQALTLLKEHTRATALRQFCAAALRYRDALDELEQALRPVIIRHVRNKDLRAFHCGRDFRTHGLPDGRHHGLYHVAGYGTGDNALMSFIGMRARQLLSRECGEREHVLLLGGLNSSNSAFAESWESRTPAPGFTREYVTFFLHQLRQSAHPKVTATVQRALNNWLEGRKTLIFCDRLATQEELCCTLRRALRGYSCSSAQAKRLQRDHVTVEYYLSRSLAVGFGLALPGDAALNEVKQRMSDKLSKTPHLRIRALARFADLCLASLMLQDTDSDLLAYARILDDEDALAFYLSGRPSSGVKKPTPPSPEIDEDTDEDASPPFPGKADALDGMLRDILHGSSIWHAGEQNAQSLHAAMLRLLGDEVREPEGSPSYRQERDGYALADLLLTVPRALRKLLLNSALVPPAVSDNTEKTASPGACAVRALRATEHLASGPWQRTRRFLELLCEEDGSIRPGMEASRRRSLWNGLNLRQTDIAVHINGTTGGDRRTAVCAAFNSPCLPDILLCTSIASEGIDLHRECAEVIHHDLPWNPALLEQRTGRIDRIGSFASRTDEGPGMLAAGIPFLASDYDEFQYAVLLNRAQKQEILLGKPELCPVAMPAAKPGESSPPLPDRLLEFLRVDLSVKERRP